MFKVDYKNVENIINETSLMGETPWHKTSLATNQGEIQPLNGLNIGNAFIRPDSDFPSSDKNKYYHRQKTYYFPLMERELTFFGIDQIL